MIRKHHNYKPQTTLWHRDEEPLKKTCPIKPKHHAELILPRKLIAPSMPNIDITVNGVSKQLSKLNLGKAAGPDNLTSRILKELHSEVAPMLSDIYYSSLREG